MIGEIREYTLTCREGALYTVPLAKVIAPGLLVYRIPDGMHPTSSYRWRIGHESSGLSVADAMTREDAVAGAERLGGLADWTQDVATLRDRLDAGDVYIKICDLDCIAPATDRMPGDVSHNGRYTDADIEQYASECKDNGLNALEILTAMAVTVPWMGLDMEDFIEAQNRICALAGAA